MPTRRLPRTVVAWEVRVPAVATERASRLLTALGQASPVETTRPGNRTVCLTLYFPLRARTGSLTRSFKRQFAAPCGVRRRIIRHWQERWKRSLRVQRLTRRLVLCPTVKRYRPATGERVIRLDPGLAFGSGSHATTRFALRMLDRLRGGRGSFLDLGTGSGILAIAAFRLGVRRVTAVDHDPLAVRVAEANFRRNGIRGARLLERSVERWRDRRRYDFVAANLDTELILRLRDRLVGWVRPGGVLCVTGIGAAHGERILARYRSPRLRLIGRFRDRTWCGFCFRRLAGGVRVMAGNAECGM